NLNRLGLSAELICADAAEWTAEPFDAVLLDAPCSSTGTIRRHPDVPWLKRLADITALAALQRRLLAREQSVRRAPIAASEVFGEGAFITEDGDLRTLPCHFPDADSRFAGVDG